MRLLEYQGKELFQKYGIPVPKGELVFKHTSFVSLPPPFVLKAQVPVGNRGEGGGIVFIESQEAFEQEKEKLFATEISGFSPGLLLAEEKISYEKEYYVSFTYDTDSRGPVLGISEKGGVGIKEANIFPLDIFLGPQDFYLRDILLRSHISPTPQFIKLSQSLWELFQKEQALLVEVNPLFQLSEGNFVAGDSKIILDDNVMNPGARPYLDLDGDIAVLASGGGASLINLDALIHFGGRPANYVEYSGNPPASVVEELTLRVLSKPGLKGCWVVGGTANFTDIFETMSGFVRGLRKINPKPSYPIVIRRDGPRQKEAFEMLKEVARNEGYDFHLYGPETPMSESARMMVELAYQKTDD